MLKIVKMRIPTILMKKLEHMQLNVRKQSLTLFRWICSLWTTNFSCDKTYSLKREEAKGNRRDEQKTVPNYESANRLYRNCARLSR